MRTIGQRYELRGELASGGMATVHLARQLGAAGFARIVAVKRLHERYAKDPEFIAMFLDEARLVARIRHPNVVQTLDVVQEKVDAGNELFIVMEYIHGDPLSRLLLLSRQKMEPVPLRIASAVMVGVLHGLHEAHEAKSELGEALGIVHRDVSPHNILVGIDGVARVLDFGVAKAAERMSSTQDGQVKGKLSYMAPEQIANGEIDRRTDIYAAAIVFWEILAGKRLFHGANEAATIKLVLDAKVEAPSAHNAQVTPALDSIILMGLARDRLQRFATAAEFANMIADAVPPATVGEVGAWVRTTAREDIEAKTKLIAAIEAKASSKNKSDAAKSLEAVGKTQLVAEAPTSPERGAFERARPTKTVPLPQGSRPPRRAEPALGTKTVLMPEALGSGGGSEKATVVTQRPPPPVGAGVKLAGAIAVVLLGAAAVAIVMTRKDEAAAVEAGAPSSAPSALASPPAPALCPEGMVLAEAGPFFMGSDENASAERPSHKVTLHAFCIDRFEVTVGNYKKCSDQGDCRRAPRENNWEGLTAKEKKAFDPVCTGASDLPGGDMRDAHPINCVDWDLAKAYCAARGARLPTEAEWEYAARGSEQRMYPWGDKAPAPKLLNGCGVECEKWMKAHGQPTMTPLFPGDDGWPTTAPVGSFPAGKSKIGAEDMLGNVWEWTADFYALYTKDDATDPQGPESGRDRVTRGGAWNSYAPEWLRATYRQPMLPSARSHSIGFRCAKTL